MKVTGEVTGEAETKAAFNKLATRIANDVEAASKVAGVVASKAGGYAPIRTGLLAGSFGVSDRYVINDAPYAGYVDQGVPSLGMAPQFMVKQAFESSADQIDAIYSQWIASEATSVGIEATSG